METKERQNLNNTVFSNVFSYNPNSVQKSHRSFFGGNTNMTDYDNDFENPFENSQQNITQNSGIIPFKDKN